MSSIARDNSPTRLYLLQDGPAGNTSVDREQDLATLESSRKSGNPSLSNLHTSDCASGRTGFTLAVRSGVNSTPDSRETGNGVVMDTSGAGSNMASSARLHGNGSRSAATGNGASIADGNADPSSWGCQGTVAGSATVQTVPPQATASSAVPHGAIMNSIALVADTLQQASEAPAVSRHGAHGNVTTAAPAPTVPVLAVSAKVADAGNAAGKPTAAGQAPHSVVAVITAAADASNSDGV